MRRISVLLGAAAFTAAIMVPALARGATCGNGALEPGEECDAGAAACSYLSPAPEAPVIDCRNAACTAKDTGLDRVCTDRCLLTPACRPLLDDPARIVFKTRPKLDMVKVAARSVPLTDMDPVADEVIFSTSNINGTIFSQRIAPGNFVPNTKFTVWKYVYKRDGLPKIYNFRINKRYNKLTGNTEFILKVTAGGCPGIC